MLHCCLLHKAIFLPRPAIFVYLPLRVGLLMPYLCDLFFHYHFHFHNFYNLIKRHNLPTLLKKRLWHRYFSVNFAKFLRTTFLRNTSGRLLLCFSASHGFAQHFLFKNCDGVTTQRASIFFLSASLLLYHTLHFT